MAAVIGAPLLMAAMPPPAYTGKIWSPFALTSAASVAGQPLARSAGAAVQEQAVSRAAARQPAASSGPAAYHRPARPTWPAAASAVVQLTAPHANARVAHATAKAVRASSVAARRSVVMHRAGQMPVLIGSLQAGSKKQDRVRVTMAAHGAATAAGVRGLVFTVARASGSAADVQVAVSYKALARSIGGAWTSRLRLVELPACALTSPHRAACRTARPVRGSNDSKTGQLSATIGLTASAPAGAARGGAAARTQAAEVPGGALVLAAQAAPAGPDGNYTATPLHSSGTWAAQQGDFTYSYPVAVPPSTGGSAPQVALSYDSQSIDSETSAANTQAGWIGDGWDYSPGYIERSYQPCSSDGIAGSGDECWAGYNAVLDLGGKTSVLVGSGPGTWHLQNDDGTSVQLDHGATNGLWDGEYWVVTTTDGTKYYFGQNHLPGGSGSDSASDSAWGVPVYSPGSSDPCYSSAQGQASECQMGWRWNLDYVVSPQGDLTNYQYQAETNYYSMGGGQNGGNGTLTAYTRDGFLTQISYGRLLSDAIAGAKPADEILFGSVQRCTGSASECSSYANLNSSDAGDWPDVPFDQICPSTGTCTNYSPTYFSTYMLSTISTEVLPTATSSTYSTVDTYQLTQSFPAGTGSDNVIYLNSIQRTGQDSASTSDPAIALPDVSFGIPVEIDNRVPGLTPAAPPVYRPRISSITTETGGIITVLYGGGTPCSRNAGGNMPASAFGNTMPCFPVYWTPPGLSQIEDWFAKSLVSQVDVSDGTGAASPTQVTNYTYLGNAAWHYDDSAAVPSNTRTWDQYRGYQQVEVTTGASPDPITKTITTYMQGMNGDTNSSGGVTSGVTVSDDVTGDAPVTDSNWLSGQVLETETYPSASSSSPDEKTVNAAANGTWPAASTADVPQPGGLPDLVAEMITEGTTRTLQQFADGTWHTNTTNDWYSTTANPGQVTSSSFVPDTGSATCTSISYASAPSGNPMMVSYPDQQTEVTGAASGAGACPAASATDIVSDTKTFYDDNSSTTASLTSMGTLGTMASPGGVVTGTQKAATWTAAENWQDISAAHHDAYGRVTWSEDGNQNVTTTAYTPAYSAGAAVPLPTEVDVTAPTPAGGTWTNVTKTAMDQNRQLPVKITDANGESTTETYDTLGRLLTVTLPADQSSGDATDKYAYSISQTAPSAVTSSTLREDGSYSSDVQIYDGMLQLIQDQKTPANAAAGRMITTTAYDSHGWTASTTSPFYDSTTSPDTTFDVVGQGSIPALTQDTYDGQGRVTASAFYSGNALQWTTTTAYPGMNETDVTPPSGGTATSTFTNTQGQTTAGWQYSSVTSPDGNSAHADVTSYTYTPAGQTQTVADNNGNTWTYAYNLLGQQTTLTDPGTTGTATTGSDKTAGTTTWTYDDDDNTLTQTTPAGELSWKYDALNRKTAEYSGTTSGTELASWAYDTAPLPGSTTGDADGQLASSTSYASGSAYTEKVTGYNGGYQPTGTTTTVPASALVPKATGTDTFSTASTYTPLTGLLQNLQYTTTDGGLPTETVNYSYDLQGELIASGGSTAYLDQAIYSPYGLPQRTTFGVYGKQLVQTYTDDLPTQRLLETTTSLQTLSSAADTTYLTYNQAGDLKSSSDAQNSGGTNTQCYTYNDLQELTTAWTDKGGTTATVDAGNQTSLPPGGIGTCTNTTPSASNLGGPAPYWESWTLDNLGDRLTQDIHNPSGSTSGDIHQTLTYAGAGTTAAAQPDAATTIKTQYGTTGASNTTTAVYNSSGQEASASSTTSGTTPPAGPDAFSALTYNPQGQVASATTTAGKSTFLYDASGNLMVEADPAATTVYLDGGTEQVTYTVSTAKTTGVRFYPSPDGTTTVRSSSGTISYDLANQQGTSGESVNASTLAITRRYYDPYGGAVGTPPAWPDNKAYVGQPQDTATGLGLLGAREYNPATGSFTSLDPVFEAGSPLDMGGYSYAASNPATQSDPTGLYIPVESGSDCSDNSCTIDYKRDNGEGFDYSDAINYENNTGSWSDLAGGAVNALYGIVKAAVKLTPLAPAASMLPARIPLGNPNTTSYGAGGLYANLALLLAGAGGADAADAGLGIIDHLATEDPAAAGDHIVLGLRNSGLEQTAAKVGGRTLLKDPDWMTTLQRGIANSSVKFTVSTDGMTGSSTYGQIMSAALRGAAGTGGYTDWEMAQLFGGGRLPDVNFVSGGFPIENPFG